MGKSSHFSKSRPQKIIEELPMLLKQAVQDKIKNEGLGFAPQEAELMTMMDSVTRETLQIMLQEAADEMGDQVAFKKAINGMR
ncbi:MAG: hypothetical protein GY822_29795 [Deltaproteobacteria bacterium]|nr:hypothetical protein [Deltaproteobacteria bacterium]